MYGVYDGICETGIYIFFFFFLFSFFFFQVHVILVLYACLCKFLYVHICSWRGPDGRLVVAKSVTL